jgi:hypothetical protein
MRLSPSMLDCRARGSNNAGNTYVARPFRTKVLPYILITI